MRLLNILLSIFLLPSQVFASEPFIVTTMEEVAKRSTPDDCWMVFENNVYDFSEYLPNHDRFMDIREWCGMDMTEDFRTKAGVGRDHREGSYDMLDEYLIGVLEEEEKEIEYTMEEVARHSNPDDCWMVFDGKIYDFSEYLPNHDKFMDIREWCGMDMTEDFRTKAGIGRDHREGSYVMLEQYYIADLVLGETEEEIEEEGVEMIGEVEETRRVNPYNFIPLFFGTLLIYWVSFFVFQKKLKRFNAFWNTLLLLTFLIPSFGFGLYIILSYSFTDFRYCDFDFLYWHVEFSIVMSAIALSHFVQRYRQYLVQLKK